VGRAQVVLDHPADTICGRIEKARPGGLTLAGFGESSALGRRWVRGDDVVQQCRVALQQRQHRVAEVTRSPGHGRQGGDVVGGQRAR
jgi:hypothetical protein